MNPRRPFIATLLSLVATAATAGVISVDFDKSGIPIIDMELGGRVERVYVDTGTRPIHLPRETAARIDGLRPTTGGGRAIDLSGRERIEEAFVMPSPTVAGWSPGGETEGRYLTDWGLGRSELRLPVLGRDFLTRGAFLLDFPRRRLAVWDFDAPAPIRFTVAHAAPLRIGREGIILPVRIGNADRPFVVDTGATTSIVKKGVAFDPAEIAPCPPEILDGKCELVEHRANFGDVPVTFRMIRVDLPDAFPADGVVGGDLTRFHSLLVDARAGQLKFVHPAD